METVSCWVEADVELDLLLAEKLSYCLRIGTLSNNSSFLKYVINVVKLTDIIWNRIYKSPFYISPFICIAFIPVLPGRRPFYFVPNNLSPASPRPGTIYAFSLR